MKTYLALSVTSRCNFHCDYCYPFSKPTIGENRHSSGAILSSSEFVRIANSAYEEGIRTYRITGGEPTLRRDLSTIVQGIARDDVRIHLDTNGKMLKRELPWIVETPNIAIRLSIDSVNSGLEKCINPHMYETIHVLKAKQIPVRINMVVTKKTQHYIDEMIDFCIRNQLDLKLLDLYYYPSEQGIAYWKDQFVPLSSLSKQLEQRADKKEPFSGYSEYGIPMLAYSFGSTKVIVKDTTRGTHFHQACRSCSFFPCLEGFYAPIVTADGTLYPIGCWNPAMSKNIAYLPDADVRQAIRDILKKFTETTYTTELSEHLKESLKQEAASEQPVSENPETKTFI